MNGRNVYNARDTRMKGAPVTVLMPHLTTGDKNDPMLLYLLPEYFDRESQEPLFHDGDLLDWTFALNTAGNLEATPTLRCPHGN